MSSRITISFAKQPPALSGATSECTPGISELLQLYVSRAFPGREPPSFRNPHFGSMPECGLKIKCIKPEFLDCKSIVNEKTMFLSQIFLRLVTESLCIFFILSGEPQLLHNPIDLYMASTLETSRGP